MIITARFVVPVGSPHIENGAVQVENGVIRAVGKRSEVVRKSGEELTDYGDAVILPGFVNAHTHLELTHLGGQVPPTPDFPGWLTRLMRHFAEHPPTQASVTAAVGAGVRQSLAAGVTTVGDITRFPDWTRPVLGSLELQAVSFGEVIAVGNRRDTLGDRLNAALSGVGTNRLAIGLSPHSPYTVEPDALRRCAAEANRRLLPICVHAAESREEVEFLRTGRGPMRDFLESIGVWDDRVPVPGCSPIELLDRVGLLTPRTIIAHANYVDDHDIALIARSGASVIYCPRTHAAFGHPPHRFMDMLAARINVCLGTDSLASNPTLSMLEEIECVSRSYRLQDAHDLLQMATISGVKALHLPRTGDLAVGNLADMAVVLHRACTESGLIALGGGSTVAVAYIKGRRV
jgi:cytosine/adenosine deaminase-related metal-dependent hydrolase